MLDVRLYVCVDVCASVRMGKDASARTSEPGGELAREEASVEEASGNVRRALWGCFGSFSAVIGRFFMIFGCRFGEISRRIR